jgi:hypothetical protein
MATGYDVKGICFASQGLDKLTPEQMKYLASREMGT